MNQSIRLSVLFAVGCTSALTLTSCGKRGGPHEMPPISVKTAAAVKMDTPVVINAFGNTKDRASVDIVPQVSGRLLNTYIRDGAVVTNGQPLFQIDSSDYAARVRQADGAVSADRANLKWNRITLDRNQPLLKNNLISTEDFDTLQTKLDAAKAQLQMDEAVLELAQLNLSRCTITSSVSGVCSRRYLDNGNLVAAGQTRLINIRSYDPMYVDFSVSEQYLPAVRRALAEGTVRIEITPRGDTNIYEGTVEFVDNAVDTQTGTILLRGQAPNPNWKLWAQQFVEVRAVVDLIRDAVMVPEGAVQYGKQGPYLFVVSKDGKAELRSVKPGVRHNDLIQIAEGVAPGENVVVLGQLMLYPGAAVTDMSKLPPAAAGKPDGMPEGAGQHNGK
jgi:membrane fusion protein, multidrug efflux system